MDQIDPHARLIAAVQATGRPSSDYDLDPEMRPQSPKDLRAAAVLIAVATDGPQPEVILTKRSPRLSHHPGQIAFPGGKVDPVDTGPIEAALREASEEIGLPRERVEVLGALPAHETVTCFHVTPVLALINGTFAPVPEKGEVAEVFRVPLGHVLDPANYGIQARRWRGRMRPYYVVPYGPYYIWGATARMLRALADRMAT